MFSIRLKQLREDAGMSQADLASRIDVSQSTVGMWESGKNMPKPKTLNALAGLFGVSVDYLIGNSDTAPMQEQDAGNNAPDRAPRYFVNPPEPQALDDIVKILEAHIESRQATVPKTKEARILSNGIDKLPEPERKKILAMVKLVFDRYENYFTDEGNDDNNDA